MDTSSSIQGRFQLNRIQLPESTVLVRSSNSNNRCYLSDDEQESISEKSPLLQPIVDEKGRRSVDCVSSMQESVFSYCTVQSWFVVLFSIALSAGVIYIGMYFSRPNSFCNGPPFIYASIYANSSSIMKYSRNGCLLSTDVLRGAPPSTSSAPSSIGWQPHVVRLVSMAMGSFRGASALYVGDASDYDSYLMIYSDCGTDGTRDYVTDVITTSMNPGVNHINGISFDRDGDVYVSSQLTNNILRFYKDSFLPMPYPPSLEKKKHTYPGTFLQYSQPTWHTLAKGGIQSIAIALDSIWIADAHLDGVSIVDAISGSLVRFLTIKAPVALHFNTEHHVVFISAAAMGSAPAVVYAYDASTFELTQTFRSSDIQHPSGLASYRNILYVSCRSLGNVISFNIHTGSTIGSIVTAAPFTIEQIVMSPC